MKIGRNILILSLALAAVLTGCGKIEDEAVSGAAKGAAGMSVSKTESSEALQEPEAQEGSGKQTVADPRQVPETQQPAETTQVTETTVQVTEPPAQTAEPEETRSPVGQGGEVLTPENIDGFMFGFELFSDGHKDCWEQRYDCAKVMLEAVSQTNAAEKTVDLTVDVSQLNEKESSGFMTWLKFEEPQSFQVGDTVMSGSSLNIIDYDGSYYFFIGEIEEMRGMTELDSSFIPKILEAAGC